MISKTSASAITFIQEEISRSRNITDKIKNDAVKAVGLVHASEKRDHIYAVAGDLIYNLTRCLHELETSLNTASMAVNKVDYEEVRGGMKPEVVDDLESILEQVRLRIPRRTGKLPFGDEDG